MSFDWGSYLELAEQLNGSARCTAHVEACYRAAVSRAYYSVYRRIVNCVRARDRVDLDERSSSHQATYKYLIEESRAEGSSKIGHNLKVLCQDRTKADYRNDLQEKPVLFASKALTRARKIASDVERVLEA